MSLVSKAGRYILNRVFGICTKRQVSEITAKAGKMLSQSAKNGQQISAESATSIFREVLPKGITPPTAILTPQEATEFLARNYPHVSKEKIREMLMYAGAANLKGTIQEGTLYLPHCAFENSSKAINASTHEFRHWLDFDKSSIFRKIKQFLFRVSPRNLQSKFLKKIDDYTQRYMNIQRRVVNDLDLLPNSGFVSGTKSIVSGFSHKSINKYLRRIIRNETAGLSFIERIKFLKYLRNEIASEVNAYSAGGKAVRHFSKGNASQAEELLHSSEIISEYQSKILEAINNELTSMKNPRYKRAMKKLIFENPKKREIAFPDALEKVQVSILENLDGTPAMGGFGEILSGRKANILASAFKGDTKAAKKIITFNKLCPQS